jgi:hypothetical protein
VAPLADGTTYQWQVVAHSPYGDTPGAIWSFITPMIGQYTIPLKKGYNLFSYPVEVPPEHATCQGLLAFLGNATEIESVARFNTTTQQFEHCDFSGGTDFPIVAGEAYEVRMLVDGCDH